MNVSFKSLLSPDVSSRVQAALRRRSRGTCFLFFALVLALQLHAAELANLRNGFSLRHEHHEVFGEKTRLYMTADPAGGYVDVPTAEIESFEPGGNSMLFFGKTITLLATMYARELPRSGISKASPG